MRIVIAALLSLACTAAPALATELGNIASSMPARSWATVSTAGAGMVAQYYTSLGPNGAAGWDDSAAAWNSQKRQLYLMAVTDPNKLPNPIAMFIYTDSTNTWTRGPNPPVSSVHIYDHVAWDDANEVLYLRAAGYDNHQIVRYCVNNTPSWCAGRAGTWSSMPNTPAQCFQVANALAYFTTMDGGSLLCWDGDGGMSQFRESTGSWNTIAGGPLKQPGISSYHTCMEYSPILDVAVFGCQDAIYKITPNKTITRLANPPCSLGFGQNNGRSLKVDPISGRFIVIGCTPSGQLWELNPAGTGTWTQIDSNLGGAGEICAEVDPNGGDCSMDFIMASVPTYGVLMAWKMTGASSGQVYLYKHATTAPPGTAPAPPPALSVR